LRKFFIFSSECKTFRWFWLPDKLDICKNDRTDCTSLNVSNETIVITVSGLTDLFRDLFRVLLRICVIWLVSSVFISICWLIMWSGSFRCNKRIYSLSFLRFSLLQTNKQNKLTKCVLNLWKIIHTFWVEETKLKSK